MVARYMDTPSRNKRGTIIVGSPRSGTTLALECLTPGLTDEQRYLCNEPDGLGELVVNGHSERAWDWVAANIDKLPAPVIKSPHLSMIIAEYAISPQWGDYEIVVVERDLAEIVRSMLRYEPSRCLELADHPYWHRYLRPPYWPDDVAHRACIAAWAHYKSCAPYATRVLEYGDWDLWPAHTSGEPFRDSPMATTSEELAPLFDGMGYSQSPYWFWFELVNSTFDEAHERIAA